MGRRLTIAGPHMGFDPASHLGGERFEAGWIRQMSSPLLQCHWVVRESLKLPEELTPNHHFRRIAPARGLRRILAEARALKAISRKYRIDVLRLHSLVYGAPTAAMLRAAGVRAPLLVQHHHVEEPLKKYRARARLLTRLGASFTSVSESAARDLVALGVPENRVSVVASVLHDWNGERTNFARECAEPDYDLVFVGGLVARKRPELVLKTAAELQKMETRRRIEVAIIGKGEKLEELQKLAAQTGLSVDFFTNCDDQSKWDILRRSRVFFFPSAQEGFGYAPLESALAGMWVVSSDRGALPEVLGKFSNAHCVREDAFHPGYLATLCRELVKSRAPAVEPELAKRWTDVDRWRSDHERLLYRIAEEDRAS